MSSGYLESIIHRFGQYKSLGDKTIEQLGEDDLLWQYNAQTNSVAIILQHLWGNMLSRWTSFLTTDGEKEWRQRDAEFESCIQSKEELVRKWNEGWDCLLDALHALTPEDLDKTIFIRKEPLSVTDAINRQLAHYSYHVGQIVFVAKMLLGNRWVSLSIPKGGSKDYNKKMAEDSSGKAI